MWNEEALFTNNYYQSFFLNHIYYKYTKPSSERFICKIYVSMRYPNEHEHAPRWCIPLKRALNWAVTLTDEIVYTYDTY